MLQIDGFEGFEEIGRGGFAVVYRAHQPLLHRQVAVKVLHAFHDERAKAQFGRECRALGTLSGRRHVVDVYDVGELPDGRPYLVMRYMVGGSLQELVDRSGPMAPADVARVGTQAATALAAAHELGVIHRDIKPGNILLDEDGEAYLADFGIARVTAGAETHTLEGALSLYYAPPEVFDGQPRTVASDIYSLGATLYHLLAGSPAFQRDTAEPDYAFMMRAVADPVPPIAAQDVPEPLWQAIAAAMAKDPAERPATAADFATALTGADLRRPAMATRPELPTPPASQASPGDETRPVAPPPTPEQPPGRLGRLVAVVAAATAALVLVAGFGWPGWWRETTTTTTTTTAAAPVAVAPTEEGTSRESEPTGNESEPSGNGDSTEPGGDSEPPTDGGVTGDGETTPVTTLVGATTIEVYVDGSAPPVEVANSLAQTELLAGPGRTYPPIGSLRPGDFLVPIRESADATGARWWLTLGIGETGPELGWFPPTGIVDASLEDTPQPSQAPLTSNRLVLPTNAPRDAELAGAIVPLLPSVPTESGEEDAHFHLAPNAFAPFHGDPAEVIELRLAGIRSGVYQLALGTTADDVLFGWVDGKFLQLAD